LMIPKQLLYSNVQWFRGGFVFKARRLLHHSTLGLRAITKKKKFKFQVADFKIQGTGVPRS